MDTTSKEALIKVVQEGKDMTPDQIEALNNSCKVAMANSLVASVTALENMENEISALTQRLSAKVAEQAEAKLQSDTMTLEEAIGLLDKLSGVVVRSAETKRKIFNGKEMFTANPMSAKEQALMELLKTVDTEPKRKALENFLESINNDEFQE